MADGGRASTSRRARSPYGVSVGPPGGAPENVTYLEFPLSSGHALAQGRPARESLPQPLLPGVGGCPGFGESGQGLRQWALVQDAEALGGAGEGDVEFGRAAWAVGEDPLLSLIHISEPTRPY